MANNLRYLLEHFCLDGQKIDISSQLDEENANNIEKINTQTVPSINARIDDIKNTDIPNINSRIDNIKNTDIPSINQKINTINNTTIPSIQENVNAVNEKADRINESVAKNTRDIGTLSDNVTMQGNTINSIETEKIPSVENNIEVVARETQRISVAHEHDMNVIGEGLSALHDETSSNTTNIENLTTNINGLTTKVNTNTDSINDLTSKVGTNTDSINGLTTKVNANTDSINTINNTTIPHLQSEIDNLSGGGTGSVGELREKVEKNTSDISELNGKVETNTTAISTINNTSIPNLQSEIDNLKGSGTGSIGELKTKVEKNTSDISTLSRKVDTNTSDISDIKNHSWNKIIDKTSNGMHVELFQAPNLPLIELHATLTLPQTTPGGLSIEILIPNGIKYAPHHLSIAPVYVPNHFGVTGYLYATNKNNDLIVGFNMNEYEIDDLGESTILYRY